MSEVEKFYKHVLHDENLQRKLLVMDLQNQQDMDKMLPKLCAIAGELGYEVTLDEIFKFAEQQKQRLEGDAVHLEDEELLLISAAGYPTVGEVVKAAGSLSPDYPDPYR